MIIAVATPVPIVERTKLIIAIIKLSKKKILNTSLLLAPIALRIPISCFLYEILVAIKLDNIIIANTAKPIPMYKNTFDITFKTSLTVSSSKVTEFSI